MSVERIWDMASTISAIAGLFVSAILVARFYVPHVIKKKSAVLTGIVFFAVMAILYLIPFSMSGAVAYIVLFQHGEVWDESENASVSHGTCGHWNHA